MKYHKNIKTRQKLKIAFVGGGVNSAIGKTHATAVGMDNRYALVAGCFSRNPTLNQQTADTYDIPPNRTYNNLEELIVNEKDQINAICILTPIPSHKSEVIACLENRIPVICEKALTTSSGDILAIREILGKHDGFLAITYNYTGYPMVRELKNMIQSERFGKITQIHIEMPLDGYMRVNNTGSPVYPQDWRLHDGAVSMLSLDLGTHVHILAKFLLAESPVELVALESTHGPFSQVTDNAVVIMRYTNDIVANIWFSKTALGHRNGLKVRLYGTKGAARWKQTSPEKLYIADNRGQRFIIDRGNADITVAADPRYNRFKAGHPAGFIEAFANYYSDVADCLTSKEKNDNEYVFGINDALEGIRMLEAINTASKNKQWVQLGND